MEEVSVKWEDFLPLIKSALEEDIGEGDVTTSLLFPEPFPAKASILSHEEGVIAGLELAKLTFWFLDKGIKFIQEKKDGEIVRKEEEILQLTGDGRKILMGERTALNFLAKLSGIATLTHEFVKKTSSYGVKILDTRKTTPGWRILEKYAVKMGGGENHRKGLYDGILIKDNHIALWEGERKKAIREILQRIKERGGRIEIEVKDPLEAELAAQEGADIIMLDNMEVEEIREAVRKIRAIREKIIIEASGGINLDKVEEIASTGVDWISIGELTHSAPSLDISLDLYPYESG